MASSNVRFEVFQDPIDNWVVWDCERENFAWLGMNELFSLTSETQARAARELLAKSASQRAA